MTEKRKIRKYVIVNNPKRKKKSPKVKDIDEKHFDASYYYDLNNLKFRAPNNQNFSNLQKNHPNRNRLDNLFETTLEGFLTRSPFERDDISFFRYGVFFRSQSKLPNFILTKIKNELIGTGGTLTVKSEQKSDALLVRFGNNKKMIDADKVAAMLERRQHEINAIYDILYDYGDVYWGLEFETEEVFYD
jgi:hypothetical protein